MNTITIIDPDANFLLTPVKKLTPVERIEADIHKYEEARRDMERATEPVSKHSDNRELSHYYEGIVLGLKVARRYIEEAQ
jgi:hypothetical protein